MMTYLTVALVLALVGLGLAGVVFLIVVPAKWFLDRHALRTNVEQWTNEFIPECADVVQQEAALPDVIVTITPDTTAFDAAIRKAAEGLAVREALALLDEIDAMFADPDIALKLALLAERRAA